MTFEAIELNRFNVSEFWPYVREQLLRVESRDGNFAIPEQVYADWACGKCVVVVFHVGGQRSGAAAVNTSVSDAGHRQLWVWALTSDSTATSEYRTAVNEWLMSTGRRVGARRIAMKSSRTAWGRYLESLGWKPAAIEYEIEVNNG